MFALYIRRLAINFAVRLGLAERFCLRRGMNSVPKNCAALLNVLVKAYKPHHQ